MLSLQHSIAIRTNEIFDGCRPNFLSIIALAYYVSIDLHPINYSSNAQSSFGTLISHVILEVSKELLENLVGN